MKALVTKKKKKKKKRIFSCDLQKHARRYEQWMVLKVWWKWTVKKETWRNLNLIHSLTFHLLKSLLFYFPPRLTTGMGNGLPGMWRRWKLDLPWWPATTGTSTQCLNILVTAVVVLNLLPSCIISSCQAHPQLRQGGQSFFCGKTD